MDRWRAEVGDTYWYLTTTMDVSHATESRTMADKHRWEAGNYFEDSTTAYKKMHEVRRVLDGADVVDGKCIVLHCESFSDAEIKRIAMDVSEFLNRTHPIEEKKYS